MYLNIQADISHLKCRALAHINTDKVGRILVEDVYVSKAIKEELFADRAGEP